MDELTSNKNFDDMSSSPSQEIQDRISPTAVCPAELHGNKPLGELCRRIRRDANGATCTRRRLTGEPELALAITVALNAAIEREYAIVLQNQSRVCTEILGRAFDGFRDFLSTSRAPTDWQTQVASVPVAAIDEPPVQDDEDTVRAKIPDNPIVLSVALWQKAKAAFLTPKVFLGVAVAILAIATGCFQLQVANCESTIESFSRNRKIAFASRLPMSEFAEVTIL